MEETIQTRRGLSGTALKTIACVTMFIDHIGASCVEAGLLMPKLASGTLTRSALGQLSLFQLDRILRFTGRLAFPIFCFLLVEGFVHTHNVKKYVSRLFLFAFLSEVPFDLAFFRTLFEPENQNVYWTLALGVLAMAGLKHFEKSDGSASWQGLLCAAACVMAAEVLHTDYNGVGVVIICALYLTRASRKRQCIVGAILFAYELTAPLAFVLIWFYNGQRGRCPKWAQWAFYLFYPVHLLVLAGVTNLVL